MDIDLLSSVQESLLASMAKGDSFASWQKSIKPLLEKKGWLGKIEVSNDETGEIKNINVNARRLQNIFFTNIRSTYARSRAKAQDSLKGDIYYRYVSLLDGRARPSHASLHGIILRRDDAFWQKNYPPNDWGCRCKVVALSAQSLELRGLKISPAPSKDIASKDFAYNIKEDNPLEEAIKQRLEDTTKKAFKEPLNALLNNFKQDTQRFKEVFSLWEGKDLQKSMQISKTPKLIKDIFKNNAEFIGLKSSVISSHKNRHKEISAFDYSLIPYMLEDIEYIYQDKDKLVTHLILSKYGRYYRLALKNLALKDEIWVESLVSGSDKVKIIQKMNTKTLVYEKA